MSTVYVAYDTVKRREVALKILSPHLVQDSDFKRRFLQEAQVFTELEHFAIVPVYESGEVNGQPYIAMRLMSHGTLEHLLQQGPLPEDEIKTILARLCAALDYTHSKNVVHRDLKPGNILFDGGKTAYLTDFGIAHLMNTTQTKTALGSPAYVSPEQVLSQPVDARTDVYHLGLILFEMLTGTPPFSGNQATLLYAHVHTPLPKLTEINASIPLRFQKAVSKATAKKKADRFSSAEQFYQSAFGTANPLTLIGRTIPPTIRVANSSAISDTTVLIIQKIKSMSNQELAFLAVVVTCFFGLTTFAVGNALKNAAPPVWSLLGSLYFIPGALAFELSNRRMAPLIVHFPVHIAVMFASYSTASNYVGGVIISGLLGALSLVALTKLFGIPELLRLTIIIAGAYLATAFVLDVTGFLFLSTLSIIGSFISGLIAYTIIEIHKGYQQTRATSP